MSKQHEQHHNDKHHQHQPAKQPIHKDWRAWTVVIIMLVAMAVYVMTLDESFFPGEPQEAPPVPAAP